MKRLTMNDPVRGWSIFIFWFLALGIVQWVVSLSLSYLLSFVCACVYVVGPELVRSSYRFAVVCWQICSDINSSSGVGGDDRGGPYAFPLMPS